MSAHECTRFKTNPLKFARDVCINLQGAGGMVAAGGFNANNAYSPCWFDLEPWSSSLFSSATQVILKPQTGMGAGLLQGYYVPYISYQSVASTNLDHIDMVLLDGVPKALPAYTMVFTGGQNGCSLLMLKGGAADTVSFVHYPNSDGKKRGYPLLRQVGKTAADILLAIDFDMYGEEGNPNAASFFFYDGSKWVGVTQPQVQGAISMSQMRPSMSINRNKPARFITQAGGGVIV
ncbi:MAG: hypothetical protein JWO24_2315 [Rhodospirillales bacterium]|jgi:hypothetical protein|nr:hypothetical protein [Rhodospirillales bacterium]